MTHLIFQFAKQNKGMEGGDIGGRGVKPNTPLPPMVGLKNADQSVVDAPGLGTLATAHMAFLCDEGTDVELPL